MKNICSLSGSGLGRRINGKSSSVLFFLLLFCAFAMPAVAEEEPLREAAESFLGLLDAGSYQQAWWEGSELLHLTSDLDKWVDEQRVQRDLLGRCEERSVRTVVDRETLAGFPDGVYGVLVTECRFEKKRKGVEVITLSKDPYGNWKVVSYSLR